MSEDSTDHAETVCKIRWHIEEFHREIKQNTGLEACECRIRRSPRNHIACCMLVWIRLKTLAKKLNKTIYQIKLGLLDNYMVQELKQPHITFA